MGRHRRYEQQRSEATSKLDQFPDEFDDVFFHNETVESDRKVAVLRNIVYKKIKNTVIDRIAEYKDNVPLDDRFYVEIPRETYTDFQWAVVREELYNQGFDCEFVFENDKVEDPLNYDFKKLNETPLEERGKMIRLVVPIERSISLVGKPHGRDDESDEEDFEDDNSE